MPRIPPALRDVIADEIELMRTFAPAVRASPDDLLRRDADLGPPGILSPNRQCRLIEAADGWLAVNLARVDDRELLPAWLGAEPSETGWDVVERLVHPRGAAELIEGAVLLGLPVAAVGEAVTPSAQA